jgi:hypothetical protein
MGRLYSVLVAAPWAAPAPVIFRASIFWPFFPAYHTYLHMPLAAPAGRARVGRAPSTAAIGHNPAYIYIHICICPWPRMAALFCVISVMRSRFLLCIGRARARARPAGARAWPGWRARARAVGQPAGARAIGLARSGSSRRPAGWRSGLSHMAMAMARLALGPAIGHRPRPDKLSDDNLSTDNLSVSA